MPTLTIISIIHIISCIACNGQIRVAYNLFDSNIFLALKILMLRQLIRYSPNVTNIGALPHIIYCF